MKKEIIKNGRLQVDKEEGWSWRERNSHQRGSSKQKQPRIAHEPTSLPAKD